MNTALVRSDTCIFTFTSAIMCQYLYKKQTPLIQVDKISNVHV